MKDDRKQKPEESSLMIFEQVAPEVPDYRRFRIVETYISVDGYRTRVTDNSFTTLEEAQYFIKEVEKK